jgi:hypothetical protein
VPLDNRLPNNDGSNENEHVHIIEERGDLCNDCRWVRKCHKYATVIQTLSALEQHMFKEFTIDLDTIALIKYCQPIRHHMTVDSTSKKMNNNN